MIHKPRKRFGQHFLNDIQIIQQLISYIYPLPNDNIVEVGPGQGALTFPLLEIHSNLIAIEIDRDLVKHLKQQSQNRINAQNFSIYTVDVLQFDFNQLPGPLRIIGNLPYNISTPLLFHLMEYKSRIKDMFFMLQKEVVMRLCAKKDTKNYGRLSVMIQSEFDVEYLFDVPPNAFYPPPKVESAVVRLLPKETCAFNNQAHKVAFHIIVRECFSHRRKTLRNILNMLKYSSHQIEKVSESIDLNQRPENLSGEDYKILAKILSVTK